MLDKISKKEFKKDANVKKATDDILLYFENRIFYDIEIQKYVCFNYVNNSLAIAPIA